MCLEDKKITWGAIIKDQKMILKNLKITTAAAA